MLPFTSRGPSGRRFPRQSSPRRSRRSFASLSWPLKSLIVLFLLAFGLYSIEYSYTSYRINTQTWPVSASALYNVASTFRSQRPRGIVLPLFDSIAPLGMSLIMELRALGVRLPIEIPHCGDLSPDFQQVLRHQQRQFTQEGKTRGDDDDLRIYDACAQAATATDSHTGRPLFCIDLKHCHALFRSFNIKILGVVLSEFREVMLMDADTLYFRNPMEIWDSEKYKTTGTLFFHDRPVREYVRLSRRVGWNWNSKVTDLHVFVSQFNPRPFQSLRVIPRPPPTIQNNITTDRPLAFTPSDFLLSSHAWNVRTGHQMDSSLVLWNKARQPRATAILASFIALNGNLMPPGYGDKEYFFLACELAETQYAFADYGVSTIGIPESESASVVCGDALHFVPTFENEENEEKGAGASHGIPLYINSDSLLDWNPSTLMRSKSRAASYYPGSPDERGFKFQCAFDVELARLTAEEAEAFRTRQRFHRIVKAQVAAQMDDKSWFF